MDDLLEQIRRALADYMASEGCSCCENTEAHEEARMRLGELLGIPQYTDGSGIDFWKWVTPAGEEMDGDPDVYDGEWPNVEGVK